MTVDIDNLKLEVIDLNKNVLPYITLNKTGVTISTRVIEELNYPQNVQYCLDPHQKIFAIRACKSNEQRAVPFSKSRLEQNKSIHTNNKAIKGSLSKLIENFNQDFRYKIIGEVDLEHRVIYFDMKNVEKS